MKLKYSAFTLLTFSLGVAVFVVLFFSNFESANAQYTNICNDPDVSESESQECEDEYNECQQNRATLPESNLDAYNECVGNSGCNSIVRYTSFDSPGTCVGWEDRVTPGTYAYDWYDEIKAYCDCVDNCNSQYYVQRDCEEVLSDCCTEASMGSDKITFSEDLEVVIKRIEGDVEVQIRGNDSYREAKVGDKLHMGDYIATGFESRCTVVFEKVAEMDIKEMTNFAIAQFFVQGNLAKTAISLRMGEVTTNVHTPKGVRAKFEIETPTSTVGVRGTTFKVRYDDQIGISEYFTYEGTLEITDSINGEVTELGEGGYLYIDDTGYVSEVMDIPDYEKLTEEEKEIFIEYEQDEYGFDEKEEEVDEDDDLVSYTWVFLVCGGLVCFVFGVVVVIIVIFVVRRRSKTKES
ncbi:FecR domain-containing protein [Candidatus Dojkabacteria bacterium]|nr:FecR domain-containing protein [Candidatus Dojkabacteria bacterium]